MNKDILIAKAAAQDTGGPVPLPARMSDMALEGELRQALRRRTALCESILSVDDSRKRDMLREVVDEIAALRAEARRRFAGAVGLPPALMED